MKEKYIHRIGTRGSKSDFHISDFLKERDQIVAGNADLIKKGRRQWKKLTAGDEKGIANE